jgi:uncharacterized protein (DUF3084 family)
VVGSRDVDAQHDKHGLDEVALQAAELARCQLRVLAILRIASASTPAHRNSVSCNFHAAARNAEFRGSTRPLTLGVWASV